VTEVRYGFFSGVFFWKSRAIFQSPSDSQKSLFAGKLA